MSDQQKIEMDFLVDELTQDIAKMLINDKHCDIAEALNIIYNTNQLQGLPICYKCLNYR